MQKQESPGKRARICRLGKKVGAMKLRPRQTFSESWKGGKRPKFRSLNSHDGSVRRGNRCNSMTSLPTDSMNLLHNPRLLGAFNGQQNDLDSAGPMMLWPLRRSVSTSPTHSFFSWEEVGRASHQLVTIFPLRFLASDLLACVTEFPVGFYTAGFCNHRICYPIILCLFRHVKCEYCVLVNFRYYEVMILFSTVFLFTAMPTLFSYGEILMYVYVYIHIIYYQYMFLLCIQI